MNTAQKWHFVLNEKGPERITPFFIPMEMVHSAASHVSIEHGTKGPVLCISTACSSSLHAIGLALDLIRNGRADVILAGGADATISPLPVAGFCAMRAMSRGSADSLSSCHASRAQLGA